MRATFLSKDQKGRDHSEDLGVDGIVRMDFRETGWKGVHWIHLAYDRDKWWALLNTVMNLRLP
jgi:hypothetical protein